MHSHCATLGLNLAISEASRRKSGRPRPPAEQAA